MSRLIDADSLTLFPNNPESGTDDMISSWIEECGLSNLELYITEDCPVDVEHALKELCWKVISGYVGVIETEPTAYDVDKVISNIWDKSELIHIKHNCYDEVEDYIRVTDVSEIVKAGGIDE